MTYYNTTGSVGADLARFKVRATSQEGRVLLYFRERPWRGFTPSQVRLGLKTEAPLTSIRRAITDLTIKGLLVKTDEQKLGPYGDPEHVWELPKPPAPEQGSLL